MAHRCHYDDLCCHRRHHTCLPPTSSSCSRFSCSIHRPPRCHSPPPRDTLVQGLISQLVFQNPQASHPHSQYAEPYNTNNHFDSSSNLQSFLYPNPVQHSNQKRSKQKRGFGNRQHHSNRGEDDLLETNYSILDSLFERIDILESSLRRVQSSSSFSLRDAAARLIQIHFRSFLVRRSRSLRELKELASIKSSLAALKSSVSQRNIDFESISQKAISLLLKLDYIQGGDQLIRDSKRTITREIAQLLEAIDGACCVKRNQVARKTYQVVRGDNNFKGMSNKVSRSSAASKCRNSDNDEKKMINNLRERVERIRGFSRALEHDEEENEESEESSDNGDIIDEMKANVGIRNGASANRLSSQSNSKKRVCFVDDKNETRVYSIDGKEYELVTENGSSDTVEKIISPTEDIEDAEERESDGEGSSQNSIDERYSYNGQHGEPVFSPPVPVKMEARVDMMKKQSGVKIVG